MNRPIVTATGPTLTPDLLVFQALTQESINPTILLDNDSPIDLVKFPNSASRIGQPGVRTLKSIIGGSQSIYHSLGVNSKNPYPFIDVRQSNANTGTAPNIFIYNIMVIPWGALEDGSEVILRISEICKRLLHNNFFNTENSGFLFGKYYNETGAKQYQDTGWYQILMFQYVVSIFSE